MVVRKKLALKAAYIGAVLITLTLASLGSRAVSVISQSLPLEREHCFVIDPGHGGVDGGATSCTGKLESAFNLEMSLRLRDLMHFLGYDTRLIRTEDVSVHTSGDTIARKKLSDLKERVRICRETDGAILLSIHQNTFPDSRYSGAQVFYAENEDSKELALLIQKNMDAEGKRSIKKAEGIYLMEHISCPGVLIECGFLSNPQEEAKLRTGEYQKELCCCIAAAAVSFVMENLREIQ